MLSLFSPNRHRSGQNLLEYTVLITLVLGGIIIGGPYVIRSWYALLKGYDASVQDSYNDPLIQYTGTTLPIPACNCPAWEGGPPLTAPLATTGTCGEGICGKRQYREVRNCTPLGCEQYMVPPGRPEKCTYHDFCCEDGEPTGNCGAYAVNVQPAHSCPDGYMEMFTHCGETNFPYYYCELNSRCDNKCIGNSLPWLTDPLRYVGLCPGDSSDLVSDTNYSFFIFPNTCTDATKCEVECRPPFQPFVWGCDCRSGTHYVAGCPMNDCGGQPCCPQGTIYMGP